MGPECRVLLEFGGGIYRRDGALAFQPSRNRLAPRFSFSQCQQKKKDEMWPTSIHIYIFLLSLSFFLSFSVVGCAYECSVCIWSQQVKNVISFFNSLLLRSFDSGGGGCYLMERNICIHYAVNRRVFSPSMWCRRSWVVRPSASRYTPTCITTRWAFGIDVFPSFSHFYLIYFYTPLSADAEVPLAESNHQRQGPADR